jgi:cytochrome c-type biogenesis protein CcmH/NrfF
MLTEKEKKGIAEIEKRLAMPRAKFVLIHGILLWGLPTGIIVSLINLAIEYKSMSDWIRRDLWINLAAFLLIGGIIFGLLMRRNLQKELKKLKEKELAS